MRIDTLTFEITNLGTIPFRVDSAFIFGPDAINFKIYDKFPKIIDSVEKFTVFFENADSERAYYAFLRLFVFINNTSREATILLRANPKRFVKFEVPEIDFGSVPIGLTKDTVTRIISSGIQAIVSEHFFVSRSNTFSTNLPNSVVISNPYEFSILYIPNREGLIYDTLIAVVNYPECSDSIMLVVKGFGVAPQEVLIRAGDVQIDPKDEVGALPLYISLLAKEKSLTVNQLQLKVSFVWNVFHPISLSRGKFYLKELVVTFGKFTLQLTL